MKQRQDRQSQLQEQLAQAQVKARGHVEMERVVPEENYEEVGQQAQIELHHIPPPSPSPQDEAAGHRSDLQSDDKRNQFQL